MANYDLTYEGSRVQGILDTGDELRDAGYIFLGEATPSTVPGTPTERVAYIGGPGTYTNFGSSITVGAGCICVFKYTGSAWSNQVINTGLSDAISSEASARQLGDSTLQGGINTVSAAITAINNNIGNGYVYAGVATPSTSPVTGKVFYLAVQAGTYTNFGNAVVTSGLNVIKYNGSAWSVDQFIAIDAEPTQGSTNLVKSGGVLNSIIQNGPAFDLSAYNAQGGVLATYANLSAALTALNALPADFKKGGMSMKYAQTSDNKYVQYRLMAQNFTTDVTQWQGVDDEPTAGSDNLVKSSGVQRVVDMFHSASQVQLNKVNQFLNAIYIIPNTTTKYNWLCGLTNKELRISYIGVKASALGGESSIFGVQIEYGSYGSGQFSAQTYFTTEVPDLSVSNIIELPEKSGGGTGELTSGFRVFVDFKGGIDFTNSSGLIESDVFFKTLDRYQISQFCFSLGIKDVLNIESAEIEKKVEKITFTNPLSSTELLKTTQVDYRALKDIINFNGNLFDSTRVIEGYYYDDGGYVAVASYCASVIAIPLEAGQTYTSNLGDRTHFHIINGSTFASIVHIAGGAVVAGWNVVYDSTLNRVSFTVPSNLTNACVVISITTSSKDSLVVNKGSDLRIEGFKVSFKSKDVNRTIVVAKDGTGDYTKIEDAVLNSVDGDIIYVKKGVYNESLKLNSRRVHLIGESMDGTIICYSGKDYANPVMEIAKGFVENMTIMALDEGMAGSSPAYSVHIDSDYSKDEVLEFRNVKFVSETYQVVGIGLFPNFKLSFINCWFVSKNSQEAFYCHDCARDNYLDYSGQELLLDSCRFYTESDFSTIHMQSQEQESGVAKCTFVNNIVYANNPRPIYMTLYNPSIGGGNYLDSTDWVLDVMSYQNTPSTMNAVWP